MSEQRQKTRQERERTVFENILPYLGIEKEAAQETDAVRTMDQVEYLLSAE